jgi:hypothetical protein
MRDAGPWPDAAGACAGSATRGAGATVLSSRPSQARAGDPPRVCCGGELAAHAVRSIAPRARRGPRPPSSPKRAASSEQRVRARVAEGDPLSLRGCRCRGVVPVRRSFAGTASSLHRRAMRDAAARRRHTTAAQLLHGLRRGDAAWCFICTEAAAARRHRHARDGRVVSRLGRGAATERRSRSAPCSVARDVAPGKRRFHAPPADSGASDSRGTTLAKARISSRTVSVAAKDSGRAAHRAGRAKEIGRQR